MTAVRRTALNNGTLLNGRYKIQALLGGGGFGLTYRVQDQHLQCEAAVKELFRIEWARDSQNRPVLSPPWDQVKFDAQKASFLDEARLLAGLGHEGIVAVRDHFEANGTAYMVMPYLQGKPFSDLAVPLPVEEALALIRKAEPALTYLHGKNILHRDLKPDNLFLLENGKVLLLDLGAARQFLDVTHSLSIIGTSGFAPPEQFASRDRHAPTLDVYALAATLYYLITGQGLVDSRFRILEDTLTAPRDLRAEIPQAVSDAIVRGLTIRREERPATVATFLALFPVSSPPAPPPPASDVEEILQQARDHANRKEYAEAVALFRLALRKDPENANFWNRLGSILDEQGKDKEAEAAYRKAIELKPDYAEAYNDLGYTLARLQKVQESEAAYRKAIELKPDVVYPYNNLGFTLYNQKRFQEAEVVYKKAIELKPDSTHAYNGLGSVFHAQQKYQEAEAVYRKAIEIDPNLGISHANLAAVLLNQNRRNDAMLAGRQARALGYQDEHWALTKLGL